MLTLSMRKGFLFAFGAQERFLAILRAYMDESTAKAQTATFAVGSIIGTDEKWDWLIPEWKEVLKKANIEYFKTSECGAVSGEFLNYVKNRNKSPMDSEKRAAQSVRNKTINIIRRQICGIRRTTRHASL
jgi:hypothetical protein